jgi:hypothetical protein
MFVAANTSIPVPTIIGANEDLFVIVTLKCGASAPHRSRSKSDLDLPPSESGAFVYLLYAWRTPSPQSLDAEWPFIWFW